MLIHSVPLQCNQTIFSCSIKILSIMNGNIVISQHVINTIQALPESERASITHALACDLILGQDPCENLSPFQSMLYSIIRYYVNRDTQRC